MNVSIQQSFLIVDFFYDVDMKLIQKLANKGSNIVLNGNCDQEKITNTVTRLSTLRIQIFHHGSEILDLNEADLLLQDSERLLGQIDAVIILISDRNHTSILPFIDKCLSVMSRRNQGKIINILSDININKIELDKCCFKKVKKFNDIKYISMFYNNDNIDEMISTIFE